MSEPESTRSRALDALQLEALKAHQLPLVVPLRELTRLGVDDWTVRRMWDGIQRRSSAAGNSKRRWARVGRVPSLGIALLLALVVGASWLWLRSDATGVGAPFTAAPLLLDGGLRFDHVEAAARGASERAAFADGSSIEAAPGARVEGLAATGSEFVVLVRRGKARFAVTPGGPRRWLIETRSARVEVVGTVLSVESAEAFVSVRVEEGTVLVRSPLLRDGVQRVQAGQTLQLDTPPAQQLDTPPAQQLDTPPAQQLDTPPVPAPEVDPAPEVSPQVLQEPVMEAARESRSVRARERAHPVKSRSVHRGAPRPGSMTAAELWSSADGARQAGDAARAAKLLERLLYEHPGDSQAALGAYTLARLQVEQLGRPRAAAERFAQALDLGLAAPLRESCYVRWVEALRQAGEGAALRDVAAEYLTQYPQGAQRQAMQRLLDAKSVEGTP